MYRKLYKCTYNFLVIHIPERNYYTMHTNKTLIYTKMKSDIIFYKILCWFTPQRSDQSYRILDILKAERNRMSRGGLNFLCGILSSYHPACMISDETSKGIHVNQTTLTFPFQNSHHGVAPGLRTLLVYSVVCNQQ